MLSTNRTKTHPWITNNNAASWKQICPKKQGGGGELKALVRIKVNGCFPKQKRGERNKILISCKLDEKKYILHLWFTSEFWQQGTLLKCSSELHTKNKIIFIFQVICWNFLKQIFKSIFWYILSFRRMFRAQSEAQWEQCINIEKERKPIQRQMALNGELNILVKQSQ